MKPVETHESYVRDEDVQRPPDRQFGVVFAVVFAIIAVWPLLRGHSVRWWSVGAAALFVALTALAPRALAPLNLLWFRLGLLLQREEVLFEQRGHLVQRVTPIGLVLRALGKTPLRLRFDPAAPTYWIDRRPPGPAGTTMPNQF